MRKKNISWSVVCGVLLIFTLVACGEDEDGNGENTTQTGDMNAEMVLNGDVSGYYDGGTQRQITDNGTDDRYSGTLEADGTFEATLHGVEDFGDGEESLEPISEVRNFPCVEEGDVSDESRFVVVPFLHFFDDDNNHVNIAYTEQEDEPIDMNRWFPQSADDPERVMWVFSNREVEIDEECNDGHRTELDLMEGWNEVVHRTDGDDRSVTQQQRPDGHGWYSDWEYRDE